MSTTLLASGRFVDDFNRANSAALGANWTEVVGTDLQIISNALGVSAAGEVWGRADGWGDRSDVRVQATLTARIGDPLICARMTDDQTTYALWCQSSTNKMLLYRRNAGTWTELAQTTIAGMADGDVVAVSVTGSGATVTVKGFRNGGEVLSHADTSGSRITAAKKVGLRMQGHSACRLDDFSAQSREDVTVMGLPAGYYVRLTDGTTNVDAAASGGTATASPSTLLAWATYTLRVYDGDPAGAGVQQGTNQTGVNAGDSWAFTAPAANFNPADFFYTRDYTVTNNVASSLEGYTVKLTLTSSNFTFANAKTDGSDVRMADTSGTLLPYWIEAFDGGAQTATIWVRVPRLDALGAATIRLYSGNATPPSFAQFPTGQFTRPTTSFAGIAENLVYDESSGYWYVVTSQTTDGPIRLWRATDPLGTWTDLGTILSAGASGQWDDGIIYAPHLFKAGATWYLYYTASDNPASSDNSSIGYAIASTPEGPFTRYGSNPVIVNSNVAGTFDRYRAAEPYVFEGPAGVWYCLYMGDAGSGASEIETVGWATAPACTGPWTKVHAASPGIGLGAAGTLDAGVVADPFAFGPINGWYYIGYSAGKTLVAPHQILLAVTKDFVNVYKVGPLRGQGVAGEFDADDCLRGAITQVDATYYLAYTGKNSTTWGWGVATMSAVASAQGCDPWSVFDFYDDFAGAALDGARFVAVPGKQTLAAVSDGKLALSCDASNGAVGAVVGRRQFALGYMMEAKSAHTTAVSDSSRACEEGFSWPDPAYPSARIYSYDSVNYRKNTWAAAGGSTVADLAAVISTNYHLSRLWLAGVADTRFSVDGAEWESLSTNNPSGHLWPWFMVYRATATPSMDVDWVRVRQMVATEPTVAVLPSASGGHQRRTTGPRRRLLGRTG